LSEPLPKTNDSLTKEVVAISVLVSLELPLLKQDLALFSNKLQLVSDLKLKKNFLFFILAMEAREVYSETTQHWACPSFVLEEISHNPINR
jgi:hypothetical protein